MKFAVDARLLAEAAEFRLRSACGDCLFFARETGACIHGWPNGDQRRDVADAGAADGSGASVSFCKEFELA